jgi:hypothetical protein
MTVGNRILVFNGSLFASFWRSGKEKVHLGNIVYLCHDAGASAKNMFIPP